MSKCTMVNMQKVDFESNGENFPKKGYLCGMWILTPEGDLQVIMFLTPLYTDISDCIRAYEDLAENLDEIDDQRLVRDSVLIIPLKFVHDYKLESEFWGNPAFDYNFHVRNVEFFKAANLHEAYHVLVTPDKREAPFTVAFPYLSESEDHLRLFMETSNWPVDPKAKHAAIYKMEKPYSFNVVTGEKDYGIYPEEFNDQ